MSQIDGDKNVEVKGQGPTNGENGRPEERAEPSAPLQLGQRPWHHELRIVSEPPPTTLELDDAPKPGPIAYESRTIATTDTTHVRLSRGKGGHFITVTQRAGVASGELMVRLSKEQSEKLWPETVPAGSAVEGDNTQTLRVPNDEIERKWKITGELPNLEGVKGKEVSQGYIAITSDGSEVRVRQKGDKYFLTLKGDGTLVRGEREIEISQDQFIPLWATIGGNPVEKTRFEIPHGNYTIELDVFRGNLAGLIIAEVEFKTARDAENFVPPCWFGPEVTYDKGFKNKNLAMHGVPKDA